jgi:hypothetical protein
MNENCGGLLRVFNLSSSALFDCGSRADFRADESISSVTSIVIDNVSSSFPYTFDQTNNTEFCEAPTSITTLTDLIASDSEPYMLNSTGICAGIIDYVYVGHASSYFDKSVAIRAPYEVQSLMEQSLESKMGSLPYWISSDCEYAFRKYHCSSTMLKPVKKRILNVLEDNGVNVSHVLRQWRTLLNNPTETELSDLLHHSFYAPSYPHVSVCTDYVRTCAGLFARTYSVGSEDYTISAPDCGAVMKITDALGSYNVHLNPSSLSGNQSVMTLPYLVGVGAASVGGAGNSSGGSVNDFGSSLRVKTSPNTLDYATSQAAVGKRSVYATQCPTGFVIPDDPTHPRIDWIAGTGCATACRYVLTLCAIINTRIYSSNSCLMTLMNRFQF